MLHAECVLGSARSGTDWKETNSGSGKTSGSEGELVHGNTGDNIGAANNSRVSGSYPSGVHAVVARDCALLPPDNPCDRCAGVAPGFLAGDRLGVWNLVPFGRRSRAAALSRLLLSRRADH